MQPRRRLSSPSEDFFTPLEEVNRLIESIEILKSALSLGEFGLEGATPVEAILEILLDLGILLQQENLFSRSENPEVQFPSGTEVRRIRSPDSSGKMKWKSVRLKDPLKYPTDSLGNAKSIKVRAPKKIFDPSLLEDFGIMITENASRLLHHRPLMEAANAATTEVQTKKPKHDLSHAQYQFYRRHRARRKSGKTIKLVKPE